MKKILTIGGGSGQFALLSGLRDISDIEISSVVSMIDSGGSTGRLRDEFGILPPGDVLKCILALSPHRDIARMILLKRFITDRRLQGHNAGNMLLTMLSRYTGSFPRGVQALAEILDVKGTILPVTLERATLVAELTDGSRIYGEKAIDIPRGNQREKIKDVFLVPHHSDSISVYPPVIKAIKEADYILIGPGDLFTSIIPTLIFPEIKNELQNAKGMLLYIVNIMTKFGETHHFNAHDFVEKLEEFTGKRVHGIIYNSKKPDEKMLKPYAEQQAEFVEFEKKNIFWKTRKTYTTDLLDNSSEIIRHDSEKLASLIKHIISP